MSITDELREYAGVMEHMTVNNFDPVHGASFVLSLADRIDSEHAKAIRELNNLAAASVLLPVDAGGEVIHVGDMMEYGKARGHVIALMLSNYPKKWGGELHWGVQLEGEKAPTALDGFFRHYHEPTVEDVLHELVGKAQALSCVDDEDELVADFAKRLTLAGDAE